MAAYHSLLESVLVVYLSSGLIILPLQVHYSFGTILIVCFCLVWILDRDPRMSIIALCSHVLTESVSIIGLFLPAKEIVDAKVLTEVEKAMEVVGRLNQELRGQPRINAESQQGDEEQHLTMHAGDLQVFGQTRHEQLYKLAKEKRMIRMRAIHRYRRQTSDDDDQPGSTDMRVALDADGLVHDGNCLEDGQLFEPSSDDLTWPCLGEQDLAAFRSIYSLSVVQVLQHAHNKRLVDLINLWGTLKMDREVRPDHVSDVRADVAKAVSSWMRTDLTSNEQGLFLALHNSTLRQLTHKVQQAKNRYNARKPKSTPKWTTKLGYASMRAYLEARDRAFSLEIPEDSTASEPAGI